MSSKKNYPLNITLSYDTVNGQYNSYELSGEELIERIQPDTRPPISTLYLSAKDENGKEFTISIYDSGISISKSE